MLSFADYRTLFNRRFWDNAFPIPATNQFSMGSLAPPFELLNVKTRQNVKLRDYVGKKSMDDDVWNRPVFLCFTRIFTEKVYCPLCHPHLMALNAHYDEFVQRGADVLVITSTDERQSEQVVSDLGLKMPLLSDPSCRVFRMYRVGQALGAPLPAQFLVDSTGKIRFRHLFSFLEPNASVERMLVALDRIHPTLQSPVTKPIAPDPVNASPY